MGMDIPLTIKVKHRIGLAEVSQSQANHIAAIQLLCYCQSLFWLLEHFAIGSLHIPTLNNEELYNVLEHVGELGRAILLTACPYIDELETLVTEKTKEAGDLFDALDVEVERSKDRKKRGAKMIKIRRIPEQHTA